MYTFEVIKYDISGKMKYKLRYVDQDGAILFTKSGFKKMKDVDFYINNIRLNAINSDIRIIEV